MSTVERVNQPTESPVQFGRQAPAGRETPAFTELTARRQFHLLAKPTGPICNLDCEYCFFLTKEALYPGDRFRMTDDVLETYIRQLLESQPDGEVNIAWQGGEPTLMGLARLKAHGVDVNVLCTVNAANQHLPLEVYRYFRDDLGLRHIQFIPIVERENATGFQEGDTVTDRSVESAAWGAFLIAVFDEWVRRDVGEVFVQMFDAALASWLDLPASMCIFSTTCGDALALEHNGDVYSCDHFVEPDHLLGNIVHTHLVELAASPPQRAFGQAKLQTLPAYCLGCEVRFACNGECPKNRFILTPDGEAGLNYLCSGYRAFFNHIDGPMRLMASLLREGKFADEIIGLWATMGRNEPCVCGSGRKAKHCHQI